MRPEDLPGQCSEHPRNHNIGAPSNRLHRIMNLSISNIFLSVSQFSFAKDFEFKIILSLPMINEIAILGVQYAINMLYSIFIA